MNELAMRGKQITKTSMIGIFANIFLAGFKFFAGLFSGSIAIVLDAVNNVTDALSSVITIVGIKLAKREPDQKHPYGYGRIEYLSTIIISLIVLAAGGTSIVQSVKKVFQPETPQYTPITVCIIIVAIIVKFFLGTYVKSQGKKYNSDALVASGTEAGFDAIISFATLMGAVITLLFKVSLDGVIGAVIAVFILKAGMELLFQAVGDIMGNRADSQITKEIKKTVASIKGVLGAYDLILHYYGPEEAIGSVHIEIASDTSAKEIHMITQEIQRTVLMQFHVKLTVGIYSVDQAYDKEREIIRSIVLSKEGTLGVHGIYIDESKKYLSFDTVVDFSIKDKEVFRSLLQEQLAQYFPGYEMMIYFDTNYSD